MEYQRNILSSLISNFETVEDVIESSMNSSGSALEENAKWMDSIAGKSEKLSNNMQAMWNNTLDSKAIKWFYDILIGVTDLVKEIGLLPPALAAVFVYFTAFKKTNPLSAFKDLSAQAYNYGVALKQLESMQAVGGAVGAMSLNDFNAGPVNAYAAAVRNLTANQQASALASAGLTKAQIEATMAANGVEAATIRQALSEAQVVTAKTQATSVTVANAFALTQEQTAKLSAAASNWLLENSDKQLTLSLVQEAVQHGVITPAVGAEVIAKYNLAAANNAAATTTKGLTAALQAAMASNPVGWIMMAVSALTILISLISRLGKSTEELLQQASEIKNTYEQATSTIKENISTIQELEEEFTKLSVGVDSQGNNISLATDDYERYKEIIETLVGISPSLIDGYNKEGEAIANKNGLIERSIELMEQQQRLQAQELTTSDNLKKIKEGVEAELNTLLSPDGTIAPNTNDKWNFTSVFADAVQNDTYEVFKALSPDGYDWFDYSGGGSDLVYAQNFASDYYDQIVADLRSEESKLKDYFTEEQVKILLDYAHKNEQAVEVSANKIKAANQKLNDALQAVPLAETSYYTMSDEMKGYLSQYINGLDVTIDNFEDKVQELIDFTNFIANNADVQTTIQVGFELSSGKDSNGDYLDVSQYQQQVLEFKKKIEDSAYTDDQKNILLSMFGLDDDTRMDNEINDAINHVQNLLHEGAGPLTKEMQGYIDGLSVEDALYIYYKISAAPGSLTVDGLQEKVNELKNQEGANITPVQTYSAFIEDSDKINEVLAQTSEVVTNNTEVTEEYKEALKELGISEAELNECFYESNPLVVKNADALNALVKGVKKTTAQNIKLAKSQAKLKYYEKYKELQKLTNGQKVTTATTLNQVKAIYAEMTALQKSISRYSMLEHQLLGTTNAYEEFAKAQEIDEANDYESKAEEMVGYLVDAFHTAKLGSESAQAAIKGLVPESVYEDLNTLDEKMGAVYDYFTTDLSKYFYVKFNDDGSLESAEMLIDNVKRFVDDGIANGVFTGSWAEWDLDATINSLDDIAERMGVTKEVVYAFLQAMETYDISWIGGDASTLLDKLIPTTAELEAFKERMQEIFNQTPIDLSARVKVSAEAMKEAGYTDFEGDYATVYSTGFNSGDFGLYNEDGSSFEILATPILPNGDVLGQDELANYIKNELGKGKSLDEIDVFLGSYASVEELEEAAQILHEMQEYYDDMVNNYSLENAIYTTTQKQADLEYKLGTGQIDADTVVSADGKTTAGEQLKQLNKEAEANAQAAREHASAWSEAQESYDKATEYVNMLNEELEKSIDAGDTEAVKRYQKALETAEGTMWDTYSALVYLGEPTEITLTVALEQVQKDLERVKATMNETELDIIAQLNVANLEKGSDGNWIVDLDAYSQLDEASKAKVQEYLNYLAEEHNINILQGEGAVTTLDVLNEIKDILSKSYDLLVEAKVDDSAVTTWWSEFKNASWYKRVTMVVDKVLGNDNTGGGTSANGTAHARGTAYARGSWGAQETETSLVGELGPELLVRGNQWTTVGENGAEFTQVKKGDIIFNHKQTKSLLENGYVTSRGKAYASGTAYAGGSIHPYLGGMNIDDDWNNITPTIWNDATNGEYLSDDSADEFEETLDWIEIRLEEINEQLDLMNAQLENAGDYASKNNIIDKMIGVNNNKLSNLTAGIAEYTEYAAQLLAKVPAQYRDAAQNGAIAITEFAGEANEATVEAINNYRDWAQKVADLNQELEVTKTTIRDLAIQKIDNAEHSGDVRATVEASQTEKLQNAVDLDEERGLITSSEYYIAMMENSGKTIEYLTKARNEMQKELDNAVRFGRIKRGSDEWYEQLDKLYQIDAEIDQATIELEEFQNAINDIYWDNFDELINRLGYLKDETQSLIDLMDNEDMVADPTKRKYKNGTIEYWTASDVKWTEEGIASLGLYAQQMEIAEYTSKQYAKAIDDLRKDYNAGKYSENEYLEKLNELKEAQYDSIEAYHEAQDAIVELNKARIDSIKNGIEKEIDAYSELIDKKKEELSAEKDLHDFQKTVLEQSKDVADIERKLAALSTDNSASAIAQRKKLEQELAEAKEALNETYYDRSIEQQQEALDNELENFQERKNLEIEKWDEYLEDVETIVAESLGIVQANATGVMNTLSATAAEYDLTVSDAITSPWRDGELAVSDYQTTFDTVISSTTDQLETLKNKWQEVIDKMVKAGETNVTAINKENANYAAATNLIEKANQISSQVKSAANNNSSSSTPAAVTQSKAAPSVGGTVKVKTTATHFASKSGNAKMASFIPGGSYTVYQVSGDQVLIGKNGAYTGWIKLTDIQGYAKGTTSLNKSGLVNIDELGEELVIGARNGRLTYLEKGSGVIPADITANLMSWGELNPQEVLDRNRPVIAPSQNVINNNTEIHIDSSVGELIHVEHLDGGNLNEINKFIDKAWDKKMQGLNNAIKKFVR